MMRHLTFGRSGGLRVSELALGTGNFGIGWGYGAEPAECRIMFDRYVASGGTFLDTADVYQGGQSEAIVAELVGSDRDHFVVATKFGFGGADQPHVQTTGSNRKAMVRSVETSLRRLNTDRIDLLWVHVDDTITPADEIAHGLDRLVSAGKILYAGLSNFPAWRAAQAHTLARFQGWAPIVAVQAEYSLVERTAEADIIPMAHNLGLGMAAWSPLGGGLLTGKYRSSRQGRLTALGTLVHVEDTSIKTAVVDAVVDIAREIDARPAHVALAWLSHREVNSAGAVVPIIGPRTAAQLDDYLHALQLELTAAQHDRLTRAGAPPLGVPHQAIHQAQPVVLGGQPYGVRP